MADTNGSTWIEARDLPPALQRVRPYTMISTDWLTDLARLVRTVLSRNIPGDFVECGVWRGGAAFLMADLLRQAGVRDRKVWLFDSFEGLPPPEGKDGPSAHRYATETTDPYYYDNCRVSLDEVQRAAAKLGLEPYTEFVKGWFDQTLPAQRARLGPIALLRLDCDWYASMRCCLDNLYDQITEGGFIAIDDYFGLDGCALAVHEFLGERHLAHRIESFAGKWAGIEQVSGAWTGTEAYADAYQGAVIRKGGTSTWKELRNIYLAAQDIATQVPDGGAYVLVDYGWLGDDAPSARQALPLLGSGRQHQRPADSTVLQAVERQRAAGAICLVFAWPAFWWIDQQSALARTLRAQYRCLLENERVAIFALA